MRIAQQLYEGIEVGAEGPVGLITYMRTDSVRVADSAIAQARDYIAKEFGKAYLPAEPVVHKGGKSSTRVQDAHEAIRPTDVPRRPDDLKQHLDSRQFKLYQLIWRRFVASQMTPAVFETTKVDFDLGRFVFRATGSRDRKSTRLNSSHGYISYAVFCLKKKKTKKERNQGRVSE